MTAANWHKPLFDIRHVAQVLHSGGTVLTPNQRLARKIQEAWGLDCAARGLEVWHEPDIYPVDVWLARCWSSLVDSAFPQALTGIPATTQQETVLWERVVSDSKEELQNANPLGFSDLARKGWQLLKQWQIPLQSLGNYPHPGLQLLLRWGPEFETALTARGFIPGYQVVDVVLEGFRQQQLPAIDNMVLVGFQSIAPEIEALFNTACLSVESIQGGRFSNDPNRIELFAAQNLEQEIATAANWAHRIHQQDPTARIAVVAPQLAANREKIERIFRHCFEPDWCLPITGYRETPYNISAGTPLAEAPVVSSALQLLNLLQPRLEVDALCHLMRIPFWGHPFAEGNLRCQIQTNLMALGVFSLSGASFRQLVHQLETDGEQTVDKKAFSVKLAQMSTQLKSYTGALRHGQWREIFDHSLHLLEWPGERTPDSLEYQQLEHWQALLSDFAALDEVSDPVTLSGALQRLRQLATDTVFHPQTRNSRIQILGLLEAAGLEFDYLWLMDMDDRQWPQPTAPHPLIPVQLQREFAMPRACAERELRLGKELFQLFSRSADHIVFSYSCWQDDIQLQPSQLLANLPAAPFDGVRPRHPWTAVLQQNRRLEVVKDDRGPAFTEARRVGGGASLIADQAQCPFTAFARWRLGAIPQETPQSGLSPMHRGNLVHNAMEMLWIRLKDHAGLATLTREDRLSLIGETVDSAIRQLLAGFEGLLTRHDFGERLLALEKQRLVLLIDQWLQLEVDRTPFIVTDAEKQFPVTLGGLEFRTRIDRIDEIAPNQLAIIDYKTGNPSVSALAAERPLEPQLQLYGVAVQQGINRLPSVLTFATINRKHLGFTGVADNKRLIAGTKSLSDLKIDQDWQTTLDGWHQALERVVEEFRDGIADVRFHSRQAMDYNTDLLPLNRWPARESLMAAHARFEEEEE
jgi:ATP-dependent helicase/nuclease subunit B